MNLFYNDFKMRPHSHPNSLTLFPLRGRSLCPFTLNEAGSWVLLVIEHSGRDTVYLVNLGHKGLDNVHLAHWNILAGSPEPPCRTPNYPGVRKPCHAERLRQAPQQHDVQVIPANPQKDAQRSLQAVESPPAFEPLQLRPRLKGAKPAQPAVPCLNVGATEPSA